MAIIKIGNPAIDLDAAEIPNLDASKITSGSIADARIPASAVSQHATSFDDNKIVNDISTLALRQATNENAIAYNTNSSFVDVFQDSSGIASFTTSARNASEYVSSITSSEGYETGDRTSIYTITQTNININTGSLSNLVDDGFGINANDYFTWNSYGNSTSDSIVFDLCSGNSKIYTGAKWYLELSNSHGNWVWQGSNDGSSYTDLSAGFDLGGSTTVEQTWSNTTAYRYIRLRGVSGSRIDYSGHKEAQFKVISSSINATGNFIGNTIIAPSSTSSIGAIITYQDQAGTNALNTDIVLQLSADGGSNYSTATLTALPDFSTGIKMAKVNDLAVTAGTQFKYKLNFANQASGSKEARIRGVSLQY